MVAGLILPDMVAINVIVSCPQITIWFSVCVCVCLSGEGEHYAMKPSNLT